MAKKKNQPRRVPRAPEPRMFGDGKPSQAAQQAARTDAAPVPPATTSRRAIPQRAPGRAVPVTVTQDYAYVLKDLRHLGLLAAGVFAVLIALGLIIR